VNAREAFIPISQSAWLRARAARVSASNSRSLLSSAKPRRIVSGVRSEIQSRSTG